MSAHGGENSTRVVFIALSANLGIALAKFAGFAFTGSAALLAESIHSVVDSANQVLLLIGGRKAKKPPTELHPLGHGREEFFWSFLVAILLFSVGGLFAVYEGIHRLQGHNEMSSPVVGMAILGVAILLEGYSFLACFKEVQQINVFGSLWKWLRRTTSPQLLVIFTEDAAALAGLVIAAVALTLSWATGNPAWDAGGSILVGCVLLIVAVFLAVEIKSLIIGEAPATDFKTYVGERVAFHIPGAKIFKLIALQIGADDVMISYKISTGEIQRVSDLVNAINAIERDVRARFPEIRWQFVEPDSRD